MKDRSQRAALSFESFDLQLFAQTLNPQYDQLSVTLAETFRNVVDDNIFVSNTVHEKNWEYAEKADEGRFLTVPILVAKNQSATSFGMYDEVPATPQQPLSAASFPWSFYVVSIILSYQELKTNKGINQRVDLVATQLEDAIGSIADVIGGDICNFSPKGRQTANAFPALGIVEATDDGTLVNNYGNILRTGAGSFPNWQGNDVRKLLTGGIGNPSNDPTASLFYQLYTLCTQGFQVLTEIYTSKQGTAAYMFTMQAQQRFASGDVANMGFAGAALFGAILLADDHIANPVNGSNLGCNYYGLNKRHTKFYYMGRKGVEFVDWVDSSTGAIAKLCRYIATMQYVSSQCRTGGELLNVNQLGNL